MNTSADIYIARNLAAVDSEVAALVKPSLTYTGREFSVGDDGRSHWRHQTFAMFRFDHMGRLVFPAGAVVRVAEKLREHGVAVNIVDDRQFSSPEANTRLLDEVGPTERGLLRHVLASPICLVAYDDEHDRLRKIELLCRLRPTAAIIMPVSTRAEARRLVEALGEPLRWAIGFQARPRRDSTGPYRVTLCTQAAFTAAWSCWDSIIFPDAMKTLSKTGQRARWNEQIWPRPFGRPRPRTRLMPRVYGLISANAEFSARERLYLEASFGPILGDGDEAEAAASVHLQVVDAPAVRLAGYSALGAKQVIWRSGPRNAMIVDIARAAGEGDIESMWSRGVMLDRETWPDGWGRVVVMVESAELGRRLVSQLPGWPLLHLVPDDDGNVIVPPPVNKSIMTISYAEKMSGFDPDIVINAAGGDYVTLPSRFPTLNSGEALIIDLIDDGDDRAYRSTLSRIRGYMARGIDVTGVPELLRRDAQSGGRHVQHRQAK